MNVKKREEPLYLKRPLFLIIVWLLSVLLLGYIPIISIVDDGIKDAFLDDPFMFLFIGFICLTLSYQIVKGIKIYFSKIAIVSQSNNQTIYTREKLIEIIYYESAINDIWFTNSAMIYVMDNVATQINYKDITIVNCDLRYFGKRGKALFIEVSDCYNNKVQAIGSGMEQCQVDKLEVFLKILDIERGVKKVSQYQSRLEC